MGTLVPHRDSATASAFHNPVLVDDVLRALVTDSAGTYVDATLGGGGHASALLRRLGAAGRLFGIDRDPDAIAAAGKRLHDDVRFRALRGRFSEIDTLLRAENVDFVSGIVADLGVSSHQIDTPERGFSYMADGPLDLRMSPDRGEPAFHLFDTHTQEELAGILFKFGEERHARGIARRILQSHGQEPVNTTGRLRRLVEASVPGHQSIKSIARVFQALRIAVNSELEELHSFLPAAFAMLQPGGRLVVISYHSLEDRMVKRFFVERDRACVCPPEAPICTCGRVREGKLLRRRVIRASDAEISSNPRARSARLRAIEKN